MAWKTTRRQFVQTATVASAGYWVAGGVQAQPSNSPNEVIRFAAIGVRGKGQSDSEDAYRAGAMVAACDVDANNLNAAGRRFEDAKLYTDFRVMLDEMGDSIDAVTISTPDHTHAASGLMAMRMGKACFCQKPMTKSIYEARLMGQVAKDNGVATQMGNQGTANDALRRAAAMIKAGVLGTVSEVHVWTNRPIWAQGGPRNATTDVPAHLDWDLWLGPAPWRDYASGYHPFSWRGWWDFGTGALGDMACHTLNMPFMACDLRDPISVQAKCSTHNKDSYPAWSEIVYEFAATDDRPALKLFWYDGTRKPDPELLEGNQSGSGALVVGDKGKLYSGDDYCGSYKLLHVDPIEVEFKKSPGHFQEWVDAIKGGDPAVSNFPDYATPLTETVLLGNLAVWAAAEGEGPRVGWDAKNLKADVEGLEEIIKPTYRDGYTLDV